MYRQTQTYFGKCCVVQDTFRWNANITVSKCCLNDTNIVGKLDVTGLMCELNMYFDRRIFAQFWVARETIKGHAGLGWWATAGVRCWQGRAALWESKWLSGLHWIPHIWHPTALPYITSPGSAGVGWGVKPEQTSLSWGELNSAVFHLVALINCLSTARECVVAVVV